MSITSCAAFVSGVISPGQPDTLIFLIVQELFQPTLAAAMMPKTKLQRLPIAIDS